MATIERRGASRFRARVRIAGQPLQTKTFDTRADAARWARALEVRVDRGEQLDAGEAGRTTLKDALDRYEREVTAKKRGARQERSRIRAWQAHPLGGRFLAALRGMDFADYRDARLIGLPFLEFRRLREDRVDLATLDPEDLAPVGANAIRLDLAPISNLFTIARSDWGMETLANPLLAVRRPSLPRERDRRLAPGEEPALVAGAPPVLSQAITLAVETAMRRGELCGLRRDQVDLARQVARLPLTKNGTAREVPLSTRAVAALRALPARLDGYVLGDPKAVAEWITHRFGELCRDLKLEDLHWHDLRHEATSRLFERGLQLMEVAAITGHKDLKMLRRYTHLRAEDLARKLG